MATQYATLIDVTDLIPEAIVGTNAGQITEAEILRLIEKNSAVVDYWNNKTTFVETEVTEYYESWGLDRIVLDKTPVVSITSLSVEETSGVWSAKVEGRTDTTDDFWLDDTESGMVRFHGNPNKGRWIKVVYKHGYTTIPIWLRQLVAEMTAVSVFMRQSFNENCNDLFKFWMDEVRFFRKDIADYKKKIDRRKITAKTIGARYSTGPINELERLRSWNR